MTIQNIDVQKPYTFDDNKLFISLNYLGSNSKGIIFRDDVIAQLNGLVNAPKCSNSVNLNTVMDFLVKNTDFLEYIFKLIKRGIYTFEIQLYDANILKQRYTITTEDFKKYLNAFVIRKPLAARINFYRQSNSSKLNELKKNANDKFRYIDFLEMFKDDPEEFKKKIDNGLYGISGNELAKLVGSINWYDFTEGIESNHNREIIKENVHYLLYNYQEYEEMNDKFEINYGDIEAFDLNPEIIDKIKEDMLDDYNQTERVFHAYRKICQMFSYNSDSLASPNMKNHQDPAVLGEKKPGDLLVCNEITMIFCKYLQSEGIKFRLSNEFGETEEDYHKHLAVVFKTDEMIIEADPARRTIKNDMSGSKYLYPARNFEVYGNSVKAEEDLEKYKNRVDENLKDKYVSEDHKKVVRLMKTMKEVNKDELTIEKRIDSAVSYILENPFRMLDMTEWLEMVYNSFFYPEENYFDTEMIYEYDDRHFKKLAILVCMNESGIDNQETNEYLIIRNGAIVEKLTYTELEEKITSRKYEKTSWERSIPGFDVQSKEKKRRK